MTDPVRPLVVIDVPDAESAPYEADDLRAARRWLDSLPDKPLSQADLATAWEARDTASWRPKEDQLEQHLAGLPGNRSPRGARA